ncbi:putative membrane protein [Paenibacillus peoriae]|uniref:Membrane protein n=1 Tax=Paenibacillus peoriae TaxID=59893 RepID=A0ABU1QI56_9BACL|nr:hypothetical protein [Paenibacillus peoriae]MDR6779324.1 putative membrane protein [Paenibacillus peoriae]
MNNNQTSIVIKWIGLICTIISVLLIIFSTLKDGVTWDVSLSMYGGMFFGGLSLMGISEIIRLIQSIKDKYVGLDENHPDYKQSADLNNKQV